MHLFDAIRKDPLNYLPEVSLTALDFFYQGYSFRYYTEGHSLEDNFDHQEFDSWIRARFGVSRSYFDIFSIIGSFAANDTEAFHDYFTLRDEFLQTANISERGEMLQWHAEPTNLIDLLKKIRERPALYVGTVSFRKCYLFLTGENRAYSDLGLPIGDDRKIFAEFKDWVEQQKNKASRPRPWHVMVSYYGTGCDCGNIESGAFTLFYRWLDEFATIHGQTNLLQVPKSWWKPKELHPHARRPSWP
ncbi:MAG TPA: hypothetical protein VGN44_00235 [Candidatus Angelobacter sp.]|jgi:hypothetical protein